MMLCVRLRSSLTCGVGFYQAIEDFTCIHNKHVLLFQFESDTAKHMKLMLIALGFPKPPANINGFQLFSKVEAKVSEITGRSWS